MTGNFALCYLDSEADLELATLLSSEMIDLCHHHCLQSSMSTGDREHLSSVLILWGGLCRGSGLIAVQAAPASH